MAAQIRGLFEVPEHIPTVASWIYDEFWVGKGRLTAEAIAKLLGQAAQEDSIPLSLLALKSDEPIGTINLIEHDDEHRLHLRPWLAALFVLPAHRHCGIGSMLVRALQPRAARLGIKELYLGTDNPGFYRRLGARVHEQPSPAFSIMLLESDSPHSEHLRTVKDF